MAPKSSAAKNSKSSKASTKAAPTTAAAPDPRDDDNDESGEVDPFDDSEYEDQTGELDGFANPEKGKVHVRLLRARTFDNKTEPTKASILLIGELLSRRGLKKDDYAIQGEVGMQVGIWYKPGMREALSHAGVPMVIEFTGEKDTGKPNPMKLFAIKTKGDGTPLPLEADFRKESKGAKLPVDDWNTISAAREARRATGHNAKTRAESDAADGDDDIPF